MYGLAVKILPGTGALADGLSQVCQKHFKEKLTQQTPYRCPLLSTLTPAPLIVSFIHALNGGLEARLLRSFAPHIVLVVN